MSGSRTTPSLFPDGSISFEYEIIHGDDYDDGCPVCKTTKEVVHRILGEWLNDAIIVEEEQIDEAWAQPELHRRLLILKKAAGSTVERLLEWFVENFDETIKLASIEKIIFRSDSGVFERSIQY